MQTLGVARHFTEIMDEREQSLQEINSILLGVGVDHVLIGGLAVGYHGRERATLDVDMLVPRRALKKLATAARSRGYPVLATPDMIRVYQRGGSQADEAIADLVGAESNPVLNAAFKERELATVLGHRVNIVRRGALVGPAALRPKGRSRVAHHRRGPSLRPALVGTRTPRMVTGQQVSPT